ncbi:MAG: SUMF1/EgtB/PvdO family nonheme iron enzyme [Chitinophagaceae bacterium]|jgi:sulfatase modifying factor 1|nr:SUMF1/EgtB/PvdO family nonheme iron enzyme [Chitinophagaceae bacterium]MBP9739959.1 SUMF1/EgtB/PvdO family nonheme iron enzyme [Chitinophagaceae bacterium]
MRNRLSVFLLPALLISMVACNKKSKVQGTPDNGQLMGTAPQAKPSAGRPFGMVYVPPGTFHMGPSDEDINFNYTARNKQVSINGFWMDATEITNNEYRQFVYWTRDSIALKELKYVKTSSNGGGDSSVAVDWSRRKDIKYDQKSLETLGNALMVDAPDRINGKIEVDPKKIVYHIEYFDMKEAAKLENKDAKRKTFIKKYDEKIYPDTLVWMRDFSYSYNDPMAKRYFSHPSFGNYPVVGISWKQAVAFCHWRTHYQNSYLEKKKRAVESDFRLPSEAEWEYAARGGRTNSMYPWGNYYLRNKKGCLLANFKPGRGNYPEDGGFYTVRADAYWPNDYGLYNMSGNVAEWTESYFYEGAYNMVHDMNPDIRYDAKDQDPPRMKRKVVRGGSWKDVGYYLQTGTRSYEYQDTAKSYIGFRCVIDLAPRAKK